MMTFSLPDELVRRLEIFAAHAPLSKEEYLAQALEEFLDDQEDYRDALEVALRVEKGEEELIPFEEIVKKYGIEDDSL